MGCWHRLFHWVLVTAVSIAGLTGFVLGRITFAWHLWAGIVVIIAVVWRIVWGRFGPTYARFSSFAYPPASVLSHTRDALSGRRVRHLGHNPLGAIMVFALIGMLAAIGLTGNIALGGLLKQGPLGHFSPTQPDGSGSECIMHLRYSFWPWSVRMPPASHSRAGAGRRTLLTQC